MSSPPRLRPAVVAAKERLAAGREKLRRHHEAHAPGIQLCAQLTELLDEVILDLYQSALAESGADRSGLAEQVALIAHSGYGRRDMAPFSDVDLMLLVERSAESAVPALARVLTQSIYDTGLALGFSVRTPQGAQTLAWGDATIFSALVECRLLAGSQPLFERFTRSYRRAARRRAGRLIRSVEQARHEERLKYAETVYLLRPNVKRSRGGLRDIQFVRWVGFARYGECDLEALKRAGALSAEDHRDLRKAHEFFLRIRNELHFQAGKAQDVLDRAEQVRLAEKLGCEGSGSLLPVERFMQQFFDHSNAVRYVAANFVNAARSAGLAWSILEPLLSHQVEGDFRVGPREITTTRRGLRKVKADLAEVLRLMDLANLYDKRIGHAAWVAVRAATLSRDEAPLTPQAVERFLSLLSQPARLANLLRRLYEMRALEKILPAFAHARGLLQFNEYHKYTVDEHTLRAVENCTEFRHDPGLLGQVYRGIKQKRTLHLAILLHDLGKGLPGDHSDVGREIAAQTAGLLGLHEDETETLKFLVHKHLLLSQLAFRRDLRDPATAVQVAVETGSPERLQMLYVLTCADLSAVGPGVLTDWKKGLLADLYARALPHLAGDAPAPPDAPVRKRLLELTSSRPDAAWWSQQLAQMPAAYLTDAAPERILEELEALHRLDRRQVKAWARYLPDHQTVEYSVGAYDDVTPGVFHKLTGALTAQGQQIHSAEIHTFADGLLLDRFRVSDQDYAGEPPPDRREGVCRGLEAALTSKANQPPAFRKLWRVEGDRAAAELHRRPPAVAIDNNSSERYTIIDVFAHDRMGLLYAITRTMFELGLSVGVAKIGTHMDQVVDVFYVTDPVGRKITDERRLRYIRERLEEALQEPAETASTAKK